MLSEAYIIIKRTSMQKAAKEQATYSFIYICLINEMLNSIKSSRLALDLTEETLVQEYPPLLSGGTFVRVSTPRL